MAVWKAKTRKSAQFAIDTVSRTLLSPYFITQVGGQQFVGSLGDTVDLTVPGLKAKARDYEWRTRTAEIVFDDIFGGAKFQIKLNKHVTSATKITDEHRTMDTIQLGADVLAPMGTAVAEDYEKKALAAISAASAKTSWTGVGNRLTPGTDPMLIAKELKRVMDQEKRVPQTNRVILVGSDIAAEWGASERLTTAELAPDLPEAVRNNYIGRLGGAPVVEHSELAPNKGFYLHKSSLVAASIAPAIPEGVTWGSRFTNAAGQGCTVVADYDIRYATDRLLVHTYLGFNEFRDETTSEGEWIFEEGEIDEEDLAQMYPTSELPDLQPVGTRKNVRIIPFEYSGLGSLLDASVFE